MQGYWTSSRQPLEQLRKSGFICRQVGRPQRSQGAGEEGRGHPCLFLPPNAMRSCGGICFLWIGSRNKRPLQGSTASVRAVQLSDPCPALEVGSLSISCTDPFPDVKWCLNLKLSSSSQSNCEILKNATFFLPLFFFLCFDLSCYWKHRNAQRTVYVTASPVLQNQQVTEISSDTGIFQGCLDKLRQAPSNDRDFKMARSPSQALTVWWRSSEVCTKAVSHWLISPQSSCVPDINQQTSSLFVIFFIIGSFALWISRSIRQDSQLFIFLFSINKALFCINVS